MKFGISIFPLVLFSLAFYAIPTYHILSHRDLQPALKVNIDSVCTLVGTFGILTCVALASLNRRLAALEKSSSSGKQA